MKKLLFMLSVVSILYSCDNMQENDAGINYICGDRTPVASKISVHDSIGTYLGKAVRVYSASVVIINNDGYQYLLSGNGLFISNPIYYTESNYLGDTYSAYDNCRIPYNKTIYYYSGSGELFRPELDADGNPITETNVAYNSRSGVIDEVPLTGIIENSIKLIGTTKADCGIPETITGPLTMEFDE